MRSSGWWIWNSAPMSSVPPKWTFPEQLLQKFMKMPEKKLPDVSSLDSALS